MSNEITNKVVWKPIPGTSQELALDARAHEILYCGNRGPGKTDAQIMRFRRYVGIGYGRFWRGVIFDREYKNLDDLVSKSKRWFPLFDDGARFMASKGDYKWVWPTGEELLFRAIKKADDYWNYHGQEFCLAVGEKICSECGDINIENITLGDRVLTAEGYMPITKVFKKSVKNCFKVYVFDNEGKLLGSQIQSQDHRILNADKTTFVKLLDLYSNGERLPQNSNLVEVAKGIHLNGVCFSDSGVFCSGLEIGESLICLFYTWLQALQKSFLDSQSEFDRYVYQEIQSHCELFSHDSSTFCELKLLKFQNALRFLEQYVFQDKERFHPRIYEFHLRLTMFFHDVLEFFLRFVKSMEGLKTLRLDHPPTIKPILKALYYLTGDDRLEDEFFDPGIIEDCLGNYLVCFYRYDEQLLEGKAIVLDIALQQPDVLRSILEQNVGDLEYKDTDSDARRIYIHPYSLQKREAVQPFQIGKLVAFPCGLRETIDITVDATNSYFTPCGILSSNCFIGWNEITKYPTPDLYDMMMSCNRSSFTPEKDGPGLPPIPLQVFSTTNPFGAGHTWVKRRFIDVAPYGVPVKKEITVFDPKTKQDITIKKTQVAIFGSYRENIYLAPEYVASLEAIKDENLREAWLKGGWNIVAGGALGDLWEKKIHEIPRFKIPHSWRVDRSFDWGSSHPFSVGWWAESDGTEAVLPDGRTFCPPRGTIVQIAEWYGSKEIGENKGLKLSATDIAKGIIEREIRLMEEGWITSQPWPGPADNQIGNVINIEDETIEVKMARLGVRWTKSDKSPGSRKIGLQLIRDRLEASKRGSEEPGIYFMQNCVASIATLPTIPRDPDNLDDIDTDCEDHAYDMVKYRCLKSSNRMAKGIDISFAS